MSKILVGYYSKTGTTEEMAELIVEGMEESDHEMDVDLKRVENVEMDSLPDYDGIVLGSPTYYGQPASQVKNFIDESITHHGGLEGKVGGAFSSSANPAGGNETTIMSILEALLIHGMVIQGTSDGDHYGPVVVEEPGEREIEQCKKYGKRVASLVERLSG